MTTRLYPGLKRAADLVGALALLAVSSPLLAAAAVAVRLDSPGPALYRGRRVGQHGHEFSMYKFRSMAVDADDAPHRELVTALLSDAGTPPAGPPDPAGPDGSVPAAPLYKVEKDPRVTRVGRILRATSIDELPQLANVVRGEMSLVGPRPDVPYAVEQYQPWHRRRLEAKPGMTGLWQVSGRAELSPADMLRLDVEYVERRSLLLDLSILLRTLPAVLRRVGAD